MAETRGSVEPLTTSAEPPTTISNYGPAVLWAIAAVLLAWMVVSTRLRLGGTDVDHDFVLSYLFGAMNHSGFLFMIGWAVALGVSVYALNRPCVVVTVRAQQVETWVRFVWGVREGRYNPVAISVLFKPFLGVFLNRLTADNSDPFRSSNPDGASSSGRDVFRCALELPDGGRIVVASGEYSRVVGIRNTLQRALSNEAIATRGEQ